MLDQLTVLTFIFFNGDEFSKWRGNSDLGVNTSKKDEDYLIGDFNVMGNMKF
jgi:hypothetical protein